MAADALFDAAELDLAPCFAAFDRVGRANTERVLAAFARHRVSETHFAPTTGYGYGDAGRETLDRVWADVFGAEAAMVRPQFVSGTHAIACALFGLLRPNDLLISAFGAPYDTLQTVIDGNTGSLSRHGIGYRQIEPLPNGEIDYDALTRVLSQTASGAVFVQRSGGYSARRSLCMADMERLFAHIKAVNLNLAIVVDNCYGEFVERAEPPQLGADLTAGSLIKNPGGGLVSSGGYLCGKKKYVDMAAARFTAPGVGGHCGSWPDGYRLLFQGLCMAPHTVAQALKTVSVAGAVLQGLGYAVSPLPRERRGDIVLRAVLGDAQKLLAFCRKIQAGSPVDSFLAPEPWPMPGYDCDVVMAAGTFVQGSTIELSADAPMRPPYAVYLQGALNYEMGRACLIKAVEALC